MKTVPILFSREMVSAILEGRKTQTRRAIKNEKVNRPEVEFSSIQGEYFAFARMWRGHHVETFHEMPKCKVGDVFWVRETHGVTDRGKYVYRADFDSKFQFKKFKWKPSIHMPKDACRLFLKCTGVRVEWLQGISHEDAEAEGIRFYDCEITDSRCYKDYLTKPEGYGHPDHDYPSFDSSIKSFESLWKSINGEKSWEDNPWVFVYTFEITDKPENF
jgi:hypothetical protein